MKRRVVTWIERLNLCPFRPFFLLTAGYAWVALAVWLCVLTGVMMPPNWVGGRVIWHAHELIFGFGFASVAGFLLTAVTEFTHTPPASSTTVWRLVGLWSAARVLYFGSGVWSVIPAALCDLGGMLGLLYVVGRPLWRDVTRRHRSFVYALLALTGGHTGFYWAVWREGDALAWLLLSTGVLMVLIIVAMSRISMRLVNDVLTQYGGESMAYLARPPRRHLATLMISLYSVVSFFRPNDAVSGWLAWAASAAVLNLLNDWHIGRALWQRWVLIPYVSYVLLAVGYALLGWGCLTGELSLSVGHHVLLVGTLSLSVLFVMAVAGSMHSGYGLDRRSWLPWASGAMVLAAGLRAAALVVVVAYLPLLHASIAVWLGVWGIFLWRVGSRWLGERPDGGQRCDEMRQ